MTGVNSALWFYLYNKQTEISLQHFKYDSVLQFSSDSSIYNMIV